MRGFVSAIKRLCYCSKKSNSIISADQHTLKPLPKIQSAEISFATPLPTEMTTIALLVQCTRPGNRRGDHQSGDGWSGRCRTYRRHDRRPDAIGALCPLVAFPKLSGPLPRLAPHRKAKSRELSHSLRTEELLEAFGEAAARPYDSPAKRGFRDADGTTV